MTDQPHEIVPLSRIGPKIAVDQSLPFHESLVHMFRHAVERKPDTVAVIYRDPETPRSITYRNFGRAVNGLAALLDSLRPEPGPMVVMMPNSIEMDVALMAVMSAGAQVAPVNPFFHVNEVAKVLDGFGPKAIICHPTTADKAHEVAAKMGLAHVVTVGYETLGQWTGAARFDAPPAKMPRADDLALSIFTGGSTGVPKGVNHTHRGLIWGLIQHVTVWPIPFGSGVFLNVAATFHIWGLT